MAGGREYSGHQRKIIDRYYENLDTITLAKLGEIVSELALCDSEKKAERLWKRAETALARTKVGAEKAREVVAARDVEGLARLVSRAGR